MLYFQANQIAHDADRLVLLSSLDHASLLASYDLQKVASTFRTINERLSTVSAQEKFLL